ncbi:hypothetical protein [Kribbella sp.]|uniref:hypothetical protein n=1 Tax=Kribbella sp. TaxID=1871183 RepID=UPI002D388959|nr:hypothetical protein [Kribbella sp.]HZX03749.1 hypothetical protein [Kribbella sp.]
MTQAQVWLERRLRREVVQLRVVGGLLVVLGVVLLTLYNAPFAGVLVALSSIFGFAGASSRAARLRSVRGKLGDQQGSGR